MREPLKFSIITTCKGRLQYLKKSLPSFIAQHHAEVIVVDFDCPQSTGQYVEDHFPNVKVVKVKNRPKFNPSEARNAGAKFAVGSFIAFVDADIVLKDDFCGRLFDFPSDAYGEFDAPNDLKGTCLIPRETFNAVEGYDEIMSGYAGEDLDLYMRLSYAKLRRVSLDRALINEIIPNTAEERIIFGDVGRRLGFARGTVYRELKFILLRLEGRYELNKSFREILWNSIDALVKKPEIFEHEHYIDVPIPQISGGTILAESSFKPSIRMAVKLTK